MDELVEEQRDTSKTNAEKLGAKINLKKKKGEKWVILW